VAVTKSRPFIHTHLEQLNLSVIELETRKMLKANNLHYDYPHVKRFTISKSLFGRVISDICNLHVGQTSNLRRCPDLTGNINRVLHYAIV
jgi:hypothetical protein